MADACQAGKVYGGLGQDNKFQRSLTWFRNSFQGSSCAASTGKYPNEQPQAPVFPESEEKAAIEVKLARPGR